MIKHKMSLIANQLLIDNLGIPKEISMLVKDYTYRRINKIPKSDSRYEMLLQIPKKHQKCDMTTVSLKITSKIEYRLYYKCDGMFMTKIEWISRRRNLFNIIVITSSYRKN
jgi:hypothetical protein